MTKKGIIAQAERYINPQTNFISRVIAGLTHNPQRWGVRNAAMLQKNTCTAYEVRSICSVNYPVRDMMLVENGCSRERWRAIFHGISRRPYGWGVKNVDFIFHLCCAKCKPKYVQKIRKRRCRCSVRNKMLVEKCNHRCSESPVGT